MPQNVVFPFPHAVCRQRLVRTYLHRPPAIYLLAAPEVVVSHPKNLVIPASPRKAAVRGGQVFTHPHRTEPPTEQGKDHGATGW